MCGIVGLLRFDGAVVDPIQLAELCGRMRHRGPDGDGYLIDGSLGIGMRRLSIIDLPGGNQPIWNEDGRYAVMQNGEIYNYLELRADLEARGHRFKTRSDTEVLVHVFEEYGTAGFELLNGMFAFALWDRMERHLVVCRDRLGIKPLYYVATSRLFAFASDLSLLKGLAPSTDIDADSFLQYLLLGYVPQPATMLASIRKLPPGSYAEIRGPEPNIRRYWSFRVEGAPTRPRPSTQELSALFDDAVRLQMRSDVPVGVFLSGGLDSSAVVSAAQKLSTEPMKTISMSFEGGSDERTYARDVSVKFRTEHHECCIATADVPGLLDKLIPFLDEPIADSSIVPTFAISRAAAKMGLRVVLTGAGGDELFGGYHRYHNRGAADRALRLIPSAARAWIGSAIQPLRQDMGYRVADARLDFLINISGISLGLLKKAFRDSRDFARLIELGHDHFHGHLNGGPPSSRSLRHLDLETYLVGDILALTDKMTMAASLEARVPFLDHRFVERTFDIPEDDHYRTGLKSVERRMFSSVLPPSVIGHRKEGFAGPTLSWLESPAIRKTVVETVVDQPSDWLRERLDVDVIADAATSAASRYERMTLWSLFVFERWARQQDVARSR